MATSMNINMMIAGPVSAGKSTLTNLLFVEQYSDMKIKRTTAVPQVYHEIDDIKKVSNLHNILKNNRDINTKMMADTEKPDYKLKIEDVKEIEYYVPKLFDFVKLKKDIHLTIYDTPGLNDSRTKDVYYQYINNNFNKFDIVIFVLDINSAMNTSDETDILKMILTNIKKNKNEYGIETHLIVLLNKCDDMVLNKQYAKYELDEELKNMYIQADTIIKNMIKEIYNGFEYHILPISCENSYIYRMYKKNPATQLDEKHINKFGANEYGKTRWNSLSDIKKQTQISKLFKKFDYDDRINMSGFKDLKMHMQKIFSDTNQFRYLFNHIKYSLNSVLVNPSKNDIMTELVHSYESLQKLNKLISVFKFVDTDADTEYKWIFDKVDAYYGSYYDYVSKTISELQGSSKASTYKLPRKKLSIKSDRTSHYSEILELQSKASADEISEMTPISIYNLIHNNTLFYKNNLLVDRVFIDNEIIYESYLYRADELIKNVLENINIIWISKLDDPKIDSDTMITYFDKLYENKYEILHEFIVRKLSNVEFYSTIYNTHIYTVDICKLLDCIERRYSIDYETITELAITILTNTYLIYIEKDISVLHRLTKFWQKIVVNSTNKYYDDILLFKTFNCSDIDMMIKNKILNFFPLNFLSEYITNRIKKSYPEDIVSHDEMISSFYKTKKNNMFVSNQIKSNENEDDNKDGNKDCDDKEDEVSEEDNEKKEDNIDSSDELSDEINNELKSEYEE